MKRKTTAIGIAAVIAVGAAAYGSYMIGMQRGMAAGRAAVASSAPAAAVADDPGTDISAGEEATRWHLRSGIKAGDVDPANGKKILYYHDPMVPGKKFEAPGKSPFMDMMLVPVYAGADGEDTGKVTVSPRIQQNLGVRTAEVIEGSLAPKVEAVGSIAWNEREVAVVTARAMGYLEKLHVRATLDRVAKGRPIAELYVPDWVAAQEEFLSVKRMQATELAPLVDAARARMRQVGMSDEHIRQVETSGKVQPRLTLTAPIGGVVTELMAREGMTVMPGMPLARINGLATVWAQAEVPESQAALVRPGAMLEARSPALPGQRFTGKVQAILPEVNPSTRTVKARVELKNPGGQLTPGLFVTMSFAAPTGRKTLLVPSEAVIQTGQRNVVMAAEDGGRFRPVEVELGIEASGQTEIRRGLQAGQKVVVSGQFLIDSEASLRATEIRMSDGPASAQQHEGTGRIEAIAGDTVTLSHGPIPSMQWGAMTMDFKPPTQGMPPSVKVGDAVRFAFVTPRDDLPTLTSISPTTPQHTASPQRPTRDTGAGSRK